MYVPPNPTWGQALDADAMRSVFTELANTVVRLERELNETRDDLAALQQRPIELRELPLAKLMSKLETDWQPNAAVLLGPSSITPAMLRGEGRED
jgi:hypothetical protein